MKFTIRSTSRAAFVAVSLALLLASSSAIAQVNGCAYVRGIEQTTTHGKVKGFAKDGALHWYGIPYAATPEGALRWKAPQPAADWEILNATESGFSSQMGSVKVKAADGTEKTERKLIGSEAGAVTLDITRPDTDETGLPIFFYVHGGNNQTGKSSALPATRFAQDINAVVVSINHRLGLLGFNSLPALKNGTPEENSGNYALLDIAAALDWVAENAASFGGDAENITVTGSSSGGRDVMAMLISPTFKGKFQKAISFSGGMTTANVQDSQRAAAHAFATFAVNKGVQPDAAAAKQWLLTDGDDVRSFLYSLSDEEVAKAFGRAAIRMTDFPQIFRDGTVIPVDAFETEKWNNVPILMVNSDSEFSTFCKSSKPFGALTPAQLVADAELFPMYKFAETYGSMMYGYFNGEGSAEIMFGKYDAPIYTCTIRWGDDPAEFGEEMASVYGSYHCITTPLMTGKIIPPASRFPKQYASEGFKKTSAILKGYYKNFIRTGNPNGDGLAEWKPWTSLDGTTQLIVTGTLTDASAQMTSEHTSYNAIIKMMEEDTSITPEQKKLLITTVLNGRWFSTALDAHWNNENLWDRY